MGQAIQQSSGESLISHHFRPILKRQIGCYDQAGPFIGPTDYLKQQLRPDFRKRHIPPLFDKPIKNPLGGMPLLTRRRLVGLENLADPVDMRAQLGPIS